MIVQYGADFHGSGDSSVEVVDDRFGGGMASGSAGTVVVVEKTVIRAERFDTLDDSPMVRDIWHTVLAKCILDGQVQLADFIHVETFQLRFLTEGHSLLLFVKGRKMAKLLFDLGK